MTTYNVDERNYLAYKAVEANYNDIHDICAPIIKLLNLNHWCYLKLYKDGSYYHFANDLAWQNFYYQNITENTLILPGEIPLKFFGNNNKYMLSIWPKCDIAAVVRAGQQRNFGDGISITSYSVDVSERWAFFKPYSDVSMATFCLQHLDLILRFLDYFQIRMQYFYSGNNKKQELGYFKNGVIYPEQLPLIKQLSPVEEFLLETSACKIKLPYYQVGRFRLTRREFESLCYLAKGESVKEVARRLNLSARTVEVFINNIKKKTGYTLRSDLIKLFDDNFNNLC